MVLVPVRRSDGRTNSTAQPEGLGRGTAESQTCGFCRHAFPIPGLAFGYAPRLFFVTTETTTAGGCKLRCLGVTMAAPRGPILEALSASKFGLPYEAGAKERRNE
jgi:hypothetical protein